MGYAKDGYFDGLVDGDGNLTPYGQLLESQGKARRTGDGAILTNGGMPATGSSNWNASMGDTTTAAGSGGTPAAGGGSAAPGGSGVNLPTGGNYAGVGQPSAPALGPISGPSQTSPYNPGSVQYASGHLYVYTSKYDQTTGQQGYGWLDLGMPSDPNYDWVAASTASGTPTFVLQQQYQQGLRQSNTQGNAVLRSKNPDGTYSVTMPDGTIQSKTLQDLSSLPGISAGDIASADKDFAYSAMRAKEANWTASGVQLYNNGTGPGATAPTMNPNEPPPATPPNASPTPQPNPTLPPVTSPSVTPGTRQGGDGSAPQTPTASPQATTQMASTQAQPQAQAQTQGAGVSTSMLPMQRATGGGDAGTTGTSSGVGNYGNSNGSWQDYELGTRGMQDQYDRGNMTYQMSTPTYGQNGETRQQYSQRVTDLQNQYNMSQSQFNLSHQAQAQANTSQQQATQANQNQQMGQSRTIVGGGLGSLGPMKIAGLK